MGNKFKSHFDAVEQELKSSTIGMLFIFEELAMDWRKNTLLIQSVGTTELYHNTKMRQHSFHILKAFFRPTLIRV